MDVVIADEKGANVRQLTDCRLDCAFGADENDFSLTCPPAVAPEPGFRVFVAGTEYGGVVDSVRTSTDGGSFSVECRGRTWHGVLAGKRLVPDAGSSHVVARGTAGAALADLIERTGLGGLFEVEPDDTPVDYAYERFCDAWSGLLGMLRSSSMRPEMRYAGGRVVLAARPAKTVGGRVDSNLMDFDMERVHRCVNHLVCGGTGEAADRTVVHFYADESGAVSHEQTLFGVDEVAAFYDYSNADEAKLEEEGRKKLEGMQTRGEVTAEARGGFEAFVGDSVTARDNATGATLTAPVEKKTAVVDCGALEVSYELGRPSPGTSASEMHGSAETPSGGPGGGGGHAYHAGEGLRLEGFTFSADVTQPELDAAAAKAEAARKAASDAQASAGEALAGLSGKADAGHRHDAADLSSGALPVERGGTGAGDARSALAALASGADSASAVPEDGDWYLCSDAGAPSSATVNKRPMARLWDYVRAKADGLYAAASHGHERVESARRLSEPRRITLAGAVRGSASFDGSADVEIVTEGDAGAAGFLAAHPVGFYARTAGADPNDFGGRWDFVPEVGADTWIRRA